MVDYSGKVMKVKMLRKIKNIGKNILINILIGLTAICLFITFIPYGLIILLDKEKAKKLFYKFLFGRIHIQ